MTHRECRVLLAGGLEFGGGVAAANLQVYSRGLPYPVWFEHVHLRLWLLFFFLLLLLHIVGLVESRRVCLLFGEGEGMQ